MDTRANDTRAELTTYLGLTFGLSAVFYWLIISAGSLGASGGMYVLALMWCPGVSALITRLVFQRNVRGEGWRPGAPRWLILAYLLPVAYATVAYGLVWLTGLGGVDLSRFKTPVVTFIVVGSLQSLLSATGEELGWRGFLVPTLAKTMSFQRTAVISGAIWAIFIAIFQEGIISSIIRRKKSSVQTRIASPLTSPQTPERPRSVFFTFGYPSSKSKYERT